MKSLEEYRKEAAEKQKVYNAAKLENIARAIDAENKLTEYSNQLIDWLNENREKLIGKKLMNTDGKSKYFTSVLVSLPVMINPLFGGYFDGENYKLRACISGGKYENHTYYCQYFDRTVYDVFKFDSNGVCLEIRADHVEYKTYTVEKYLAANNAVKQAKEEIKKLEERIRELKSDFPYSLYEFNF